MRLSFALAVTGFVPLVSYACVSDSTPTPAQVVPDASLAIDSGGNDDAAAIDAASDATNQDAAPADPWSRTGCAAPTTGPTNHANTISANETWTAAGSPHVMPSGVTIAASATVTIEPCAELQLGAGQTLLVDGKLVAQGTQDHAIVVGPSVAGQRFAQIRVRAPGSISLEHVDIHGGGQATTYGSMLQVEGAWPVVKPISVKYARVRDSAGIGVYLPKWAAFADGSTQLVVSGAGAVDSANPYPVRISFNALASMPTGTFTGNAKDEIQIIGESPHYTVEVDDTLHDRGVPYHVGGGGEFGQMRIVGTGGLATLTIDEGVTMRFDTNGANRGYMRVGSSSSTADGALVAVGSAAKPIVFSSGTAAPAAGDWAGLEFIGKVAATTKLDHVVVEYGGAHDGANGYGCPPSSAPSGSVDSAVVFFTEPTSEFITNSQIKDSSTNGFWRGWQNAGATTVDFLPTNTFTNVALCNQIEPKPSSGVCPASPTCPK